MRLLLLGHSRMLQQLRWPHGCASASASQSVRGRSAAMEIQGRRAWASRRHIGSSSHLLKQRTPMRWCARPNSVPRHPVPPCREGETVNRWSIQCRLVSIRSCRTMPMPPLNPNSIEIHTAVTRSQRDYLMHLAATPGLTKTGTLTELLSYAAATFLTRKPYEHPSWEWIRPE